MRAERQEREERVKERETAARERYRSLGAKPPVFRHKKRS